MGTTESHRDARESGNVAVFAMLSLLILFLGVAHIAQVGLLTHRASHAQAVADLSALSGAVTQAATLNQIARLNQEIVTAYEEIEQVCSSTVFPSREEALEYIGEYEEFQTLTQEMIGEANYTGASLAMEYARRVHDLNCNAEAEFEYLGTDDLAASVIPESFSRWEEQTIVFYYISGKVIVRESKQVTVWMVKDTPLIIAFAAGSSWPEGLGFRGEGALGALPSMRTAAQAKPTGGRIYEPEPFYLTKLIALKTPNAPFARRFGRKASEYEH